MPLPVIPGVYRVSFEWAGPSGLTAANVMHFRDPNHSPGDSTPTLVADQIIASWLANQLACIPNSCAITTLVVTHLDGVTASYAKSVTGAKWAGAVNGSDPIPQLACIVKLTTALRGRSNRGRAFLPFVGESQQNAGTILNTSVATMQTAWDSFAAAITAGAIMPLKLAIASYTTETSHDVVGVQVENLAGTQRRRMSRLRS